MPSSRWELKKRRGGAPSPRIGREHSLRSIRQSANGAEAVRATWKAKPRRVAARERGRERVSNERE